MNVIQALKRIRARMYSVDLGGTLDLTGPPTTVSFLKDLLESIYSEASSAEAEATDQAFLSGNSHAPSCHTSTA